MMHGTKKSDPSVVPEKPANKAEQHAAESVEGRGGTKRNAELQSTVRTQGREAVSQAQDRIREAVNRNKTEKLTALLHESECPLSFARSRKRYDCAGMCRLTSRGNISGP